MKKNKIVTPWNIDQDLLALIPCDAYKLVHRLMYPTDTLNLYLVYTARGGQKAKFDTIAWNMEYVKKVINHIFDNFVEHVILLSQENQDGIITKKLLKKINIVFGDKQFSHDFVSCLKKLGTAIKDTRKLPLIVKARKTNEWVKYQQALITITGTNNINPEFIWLINYFETIILENIWQFNTSLTTARDYYYLVKKFADKTTTNSDFINYQCHDFSMRGMSSLWSALYSASAHLMYFDGSDTIIGGDNARSVFASEHSVMCADGVVKERETFARLIKKFPNGPLSLVCDTWNLWTVLDEILPSLKREILKRNGKLVIRPDSGDPIEIVCGKPKFSWKDKSTWGVIHYLDHYFGCKVNKKGYKELHDKLGIIYGDAITYERTQAILENLTKQKYASSNIVFGVGATTYQSVTRDTLGFVSKATAICKAVDNKKVWSNLEKNPVTDPKKRSLTGRFLNDKELVRIY